MEHEVACLLAESRDECPRDARKQVTETNSKGAHGGDRTTAVHPPSDDSALCAKKGARRTGAGLAVGAATTAGAMIGDQSTRMQNAPELPPGRSDPRTRGGSQGHDRQGENVGGVHEGHRGGPGSVAAPSRSPAKPVGSTLEADDDEAWGRTDKLQACEAEVRGGQEPRNRHG